MTDHDPGQLDDLAPRLAGWFDREVRQAAADLRAAPLGSTRAAGRSRDGSIAPLVAVAAVVIAVAAGLTRIPELAPSVEPTGSASPGSSASGPPPTTVPNQTATTIPALSVGSRYPDGIPSSLGGRYVARASNIDGEPNGDGSFLLGGWVFDFASFAYACPDITGTPPPFGPVCGTPFLAQNPLTDEQPRVMLDGWTATIPAGPVVLQVHRHDARAALCSTEQREACENMAVIEGVVWAGDSTTATTPREPTDTFRRLIEADPSLLQAKVSAVGVVVPTSSSLHPVPPFVPFTNCVPPFPDQAWEISGAGIAYVLVFPTTADREAVEQEFSPSGFRGKASDGGSCSATIDGLFIHPWVAVDNVMVAVDVPASSLAPWAGVDAVRAALARP